MALDERAFFTEKPEDQTGALPVPEVPADLRIQRPLGAPHQEGSPAGGANDEDRAKFAKLRDYLLRVDDEVVCKTCGKKFEIPSQQSLLFVDQLAGLPNDEDLEREIAAASGEPETGTSREKPAAAGALHAEVERLEITFHPVVSGLSRNLKFDSSAETRSCRASTVQSSQNTVQPRSSRAASSGR